MKILLIGAGGHARNIIEMLSAAGHELVGYVDPNPCAWIEVQRWERESDTDALPADVGIVLGIGGVTPDELRKRGALLRRYLDRGRAAPPIVHPQAVVSRTASLGQGCEIMAGVVLQAACTIGEGAIVNALAFIEHDAIVGTGTHIAPGATVLGAVKVGAFAMIGAGAVVLPGASVPEGMLVRAATRYPAKPA